MSDYMNKLTTKQLKELESELVSIYSDTTRTVIKQLKKVLADLETGLEGVERLNALNKRDRLEKLLKRLMEDIHDTNLESVKKINDNIINTFINNQEYGAFLVDHATGIATDWALYDRKIIQEILLGDSNPFYHLALDSFKDKDLIYRALKRELAQGIVLGESIPKIAKRIQSIINSNRYDSIRIARTETGRAENAGRLNSFKQAEKEGIRLKKQWSSVADARTRDSHLLLNMESVGLDERFSNGLDQPCGDGPAKEVINCRCTMTVEFVDYEKTKKEIELDEELKRMTFEEWKERKGL